MFGVLCGSAAFLLTFDCGLFADVLDAEAPSPAGSDTDFFGSAVSEVLGRAESPPSPASDVDFRGSLVSEVLGRAEESFDSLVFDVLGPTEDFRGSSGFVLACEASDALDDADEATELRSASALFPSVADTDSFAAGGALDVPGCF